MNAPLLRCRHAGASPRHPHHEHGIVLFVALLVMVALSIAGVALLRSTDAATAVTGNLVLKQAASLAVDRGIERAVHALWEDAPGLDRTQHAPAQNFFACIRGTAGGCMPANNVVPKIPDLLLSANGCSGAGLASGASGESVVPQAVFE